MRRVVWLLAVLALEARAATASRAVSNAASTLASRSWRLGLRLEGDSVQGKVGGTTKATAGLGFGAGVALSFVPIPWFFTELKVGFQYLTLTRSESFSGVLTEPNSTEFTQKLGFASVTGLLRARLMSNGRVGQPDWLLDVGAEYLHPILARQSDSTGDTVSFTSTNRMALIVGGPSVHVPVGDRLVIEASLHGFYNLGARNGNKVYGARFGFGGTYAL